MRRYTAQEMRELAGQIEYDRSVDYYPTVVKLAAMLRQAADMMEREKEYEYAEKFKEGIVSCLHREVPGDKSDMYYGSVVVRRVVGEWEEVSE